MSPRRLPVGPAVTLPALGRVVGLAVVLLIASPTAAPAQATAPAGETGPPAGRPPEPTQGEPASGEPERGDPEPGDPDRGAPPEDSAAAAPRDGLPEKYRQWLAEVDVFITEEERETFLGLSKDYQRDYFIDRFWRQRDPYPSTGRNELRLRWERRVKAVKSWFGTFDDERARVLLLNGVPVVRHRIKCRAAFWPVEVWFYPQGSDRYRSPFALIFYRRGGDKAPWLLWHPHYGIEELRTFDRKAGCTQTDTEYFRFALRWIVAQGDFGQMTILQRVTTPPDLAEREWVATFASYSTDLDPTMGEFDAELVVDFPGWYQNRTVTQGTLQVALADVATAELAGHASYNFVLTGEVLLGDTLFDTFRYKFDFPADSLVGETEVPLVFHRYLRAGGPYTLILKLEDLNGGAASRLERPITVPVVKTAEMPPPADPQLARILAEANEAISLGETSIKLVPPIGDLLSGLVRFDTLVTGDRIQKVKFFLDGEPIFTKTRPPYSVELDLGPFPRGHLLAVSAFDADGNELVSDELLVNAGGNRFRVRLMEPQRGKRYVASLRARAEVEVPEGETVDRVEFFLNEDRLATLFQPPWVQPVVLPQNAQLSYVRVVAYRTDGSFTEDVAFINSPDFADKLKVQMVELFTSAFDRQGRPVEDLARSDFEIFEEGRRQEIVRFEQVGDRPIHTAILLDVSASMKERLEVARGAALSFFEEAIEPKDRAAIITFNDRPYLAVKFTNDLSTYASGLAGLKAERGTALYDSLIYGLFYFTGVKGQRAILMLSDGKDEGSRFTFDEALEFARRAGVTIYSIGLDLGAGSSDEKRKLTRFADETGGRSFFLDSIDQLASVYAEIQEELRSQYLLVYQSDDTSTDGDFRKVELKVDRKGVDVKTLRGYYP